ncbi:hypothetical protein P692DRAFT_201870982 [Suillus brevipes Sb2]|nr:hypothetical protein P692DRAFT_201870982 [Suillus brevipes Sb2]
MLHLDVWLYLLLVGDEFAVEAEVPHSSCQLTGTAEARQVLWKEEDYLVYEHLSELLHKTLPQQLEGVARLLRELGTFDLWSTLYLLKQPTEKQGLAPYSRYILHVESTALPSPFRRVAGRTVPFAPRGSTTEGFEAHVDEHTDVEAFIIMPTGSAPARVPVRVRVTAVGCHGTERDVGRPEQVSGASYLDVRRSS